MTEQKQEGNSMTKTRNLPERDVRVIVQGINGDTVADTTVSSKSRLSQFTSLSSYLIDKNGDLVKFRTLVETIAGDEEEVTLVQIGRAFFANVNGKRDGHWVVDRVFAEAILDTMEEIEDPAFIARAFMAVTCPAAFNKPSDAELFMEGLKYFEEICRSREDLAQMRPFFQELNRVFSSRNVNSIAVHSCPVGDFRMEWVTRNLQRWRKQLFPHANSGAHNEVRNRLRRIDLKLEGGPQSPHHLEDIRQRERRLNTTPPPPYDPERVRELLRRMPPVPQLGLNAARLEPGFPYHFLWR